MYNFVFNTWGYHLKYKIVQIQSSAIVNPISKWGDLIFEISLQGKRKASTHKIPSYKEQKLAYLPIYVSYVNYAQNTADAVKTG